MIGRDDVRVGRDLFDLALARVGHAGEEVDQSSCNVLVRGLKVDDHRALFLQMVGDLARVFKALGLEKYQKNALRFSFSQFTTEEEINKTADTLKDALGKIIKKS